MSLAKYNAFEHLSSSLLKKPGDLMGTLTMYCDDSGNKRKDLTVAVAGYLGTVQQWKGFSPKWQRALDLENVQVMHRTDLETFHGEFIEERGWDPDRRTAFVKKLHAIIKRYTYTIVGCSVIKTDFERVLPGWLQRMYGGPYGWCAQDCIIGCRYWCDEHKRHDDLVDWIFEAGTEGAGQIMAMLDSLYVSPVERTQYRLNSWTFAGKNVLPLQAADVGAYEVFKYVENRIARDKVREVRRSAKDLFRQHESGYLHYWDAARLEEWLVKAKDLIERMAAVRPKDFV